MAVRNTLVDRVKAAWNIIRDRDPRDDFAYEYGPAYSFPYHRRQLTSGTEQSIISAVYNRCAIDVAMIPMRHIRVDENNQYLEQINSGLNSCLSLSANVDQSSQAFMQEAVLSMFDEGVIAIVPVDTTVNPVTSSSFDILSMRTGKILDWYPRHVRVEVYNDNTKKGTKV